MGRLTNALLITALVVATSQTSLPDCPDPTQADFDYVVVGAGAGGGPLAARLAESGFSVLVVDAGHNVVNVNTTIPLYFGRAVDDPQLELNYTFDEYRPGFKFQKNDSWYPRARALGGSTIHNALINIIENTKKDFDDIAATFDDRAWSRNNMQEYFKLTTSLSQMTAMDSPDLQLVDVATTLATSGSPVADFNSRADVDAIGVNAPSYTMDENYNRTSVHQRLLDVHQSRPRHLQFSLDTLATKILMCKTHQGTATAFGVTIAPGSALAVASNFNGKAKLKTKNILVRREVIISAGVFQSPQLSMLSGIGDREHLIEHGIDPIVHLPGVGQNLQDHDEVAVIWQMKQNYSLLDGCTFLSDPKDDPCLAFWTESDHKNVYSFGAALDVITSQSSTNLSEPDIMTYFAPAYFPGFVRGFAQALAENHNAFTAVTLKAHPSSRGTVRLTGSHPQDTLNIQKLHFQAENGPQDVADIREAIKRARAIVAQPAFSIHVESEVFPGPQAQTDEEIETHIYENIFGHHACCTNAIGPDGVTHENSVLDGDFKVRGVANLRVVDSSSFPNVPGYFVTTPIYMISEKAADVIISAAGEDWSQSYAGRLRDALWGAVCQFIFGTT